MKYISSPIPVTDILIQFEQACGAAHLVCTGTLHHVMQGAQCRASIDGAPYLVRVSVADEQGNRKPYDPNQSNIIFEIESRHDTVAGAAKLFAQIFEKFEELRRERLPYCLPRPDDVVELG